MDPLLLSLPSCHHCRPACPPSAGWSLAGHMLLHALPDPPKAPAGQAAGLGRAIAFVELCELLNPGGGCLAAPEELGLKSERSWKEAAQLAQSLQRVSPPSPL